MGTSQISHAVRDRFFRLLNPAADVSPFAVAESVVSAMGDFQLEGRPAILTFIVQEQNYASLSGDPTPKDKYLHHDAPESYVVTDRDHQRMERLNATISTGIAYRDTPEGLGERLANFLAQECSTHRELSAAVHYILNDSRLGDYEQPPEPKYGKMSDGMAQEIAFRHRDVLRQIKAMASTSPTLTNFGAAVYEAVKTIKDDRERALILGLVLGSTNVKIINLHYPNMETPTLN